MLIYKAIDVVLCLSVEYKNERSQKRWVKVRREEARIEKAGLLQKLKRLKLPIIKIYLNMIKPIFFFFHKLNTVGPSFVFESEQFVR